MDINVTKFTCLPIKKEVEDSDKVNLQKMSNLDTDPLSAKTVNKSVHWDQIDASTVSSSSSAKSSTPKKRTRRRYVYSRPKKKKKKDTCENLVDTMNFLNVEQLSKSNDNHSDCSSDTIILDDLSEEVSKDGANIGNEISNHLTEEAKLQPPELGRLLISDGMLLGNTSGVKRKKGASGKSRARSTKSKGKQPRKTIQSELMNEIVDAPVLSIKKEFEEVPEPLTEPPVLLPSNKEPANIFSEKDTTFPSDFQDTTNLFSASIDTTTHANKRRKPQTARRGKKKQISSDRIVMQQPENNTLTFDNSPIKNKNYYDIGQSIVNSTEILSTSSFFGSSVTEMSKTKMTIAKKRSPAKKNITTSLVSGCDGNISNFLKPPFSNVLEQNPSCHPTNTTLTENEQNFKSKRSSPNKRNTKQGNLKSLDSLGADMNACDFSSAKKTSGRSPRKTPSKKSVSSKQKELANVDRQCPVKSSLVISVKKELSETLYSDKSAMKHRESNNNEGFESTNKALSDHNVNNAVSSAKKGISKTYVSLSFEEDTSKKDETDEHLSFLLSLRSKKFKSKTVKGSECLKKSSTITGDSSKSNFKRSSSPVKSDLKLQSGNIHENLTEESVSNSESLLQSNTSCATDLNIANVKKETGHFPKNSVKMHLVNKMGVKSVNNGVDCSKITAPNSNTVTQSTVQSESSTIHTSNSSTVNLEKTALSDAVKKEPIDLQENESTILRSILINVEKLQKNDDEKTAMQSLDKLVKTCLSHFSEKSTVSNSDTAKLPSDENNLRIHDVDVPQLGSSFLELGQKSSENLISTNNNDVLNSFAVSSESVQGKTCELSITLPHIHIKQEQEEVSNAISKTQNSSTLEAQTLHKQGNERTFGDASEEACLTTEQETSCTNLSADKRPNIEQSQLNNLSQNKTSFVETRVLPTAYIANTASKSQDSLELNRNKMSESLCNDSLSTQIKKEPNGAIKNVDNAGKEYSTTSPVSLVELSENNVTRLTENLPISDSLNTCTIQSLQKNICDVDNAVASTSQTFMQNNASNYVSTPVVSIKSEFCSNTNDGSITHQKNTDTSVVNDILSSAAKEQFLLEPDPETTSATQITEPTSVSLTINSNQSCVVSDAVMADAEKSFSTSSTSVITKRAVNNSSLISDSLGLSSKDNIGMQDDLILISDESSSDSSSISSSSDSDNESIHSLGDLEGPPRKKTLVNLSTGEVIVEGDNLVSTNQDLSNSSCDKNLSDVNKSKSADQSSFSEFMERIDNHVTRARELEKELNCKVVEPEVADELDTLLTEIPDLVTEHVDVSNKTAVCDIASISRSDTPDCQVNFSTPVHEILENSLDSIMTSCSSSYSSNLAKFDFSINYKKNELKFRQHPYPGDVPISKRKSEAYYFRYEKDILNLTIRDIAMKLKEAEKIELHAPEDPGDAIRLDVFRLVPEEVECYYHLLTTDPSLTLISKYNEESTVSSENGKSVDDVICLSGSPSIETSACSLSEAPTNIFANQNIDKAAIASFENNSFDPNCTEQDREPGSSLINDVVFINEITNSPSQNVIKNSQELKLSSNDTNVEVLEISNKDQTGSYENVAKDIPVSIPPLSSEPKFTNLSLAVEDSTGTNTFTNNNKIISSFAMSESLSRSSVNMLGNEKSNSSFGVEKMNLTALNVCIPNEKILSNTTPNSGNASLPMDMSDNFVFSTSNVESSVNIADSHSGKLNNEPNKEITGYSDKPVLPAEQCSSLNSIPEQSFSIFKQPSLNLSVPTLQLSDSSSEYPKLLPIPETVKNAASEFVGNQIEEQSSELLSFQVSKSCSGKDVNSQAIPDVITNPILSKLDLPTAELRKILENVNILPSPECSKPSNLSNFKETYQYDHASYSHISPQHVVDYGHGISGNDRLLNVSNYDKEYPYYDREPLIKIPIVRDYGHRSLEDLDNCKLDAFNKETVSTTTEVRQEVSNDAPAGSKSDLAPDSDEDNFDNDSELPVESSYDQVSNESEQIRDENNETAPQDHDLPSEKPQYKSRFQRVMERVSSKKSSKVQPNEHLLTDCFPLKSSKDKSCIKKPIALVQPCSQKFTKNLSKEKKCLPLKDKLLSFKNKEIKALKSKETKALKNKETKALKNKETKAPKNEETKTSKKNKTVVKSKKKSPVKNKPLDDASSLFRPDKIVKKVETKEKSTSKSNPVKSSESPGNRLYGRVTNRGSFLTQSSINQPPKPKIHVGKKSLNKIKVTRVPTDELHLMVHSPNIDIIPTSKQLPTCSNELFKSDPKIERSTSFLESTIRTTICSKTSFNLNNSFLRPQLKDPRTVLKNLSPDIAYPTANASSNFFNTPEPLISSNLSSILPNIQSRKSCLPCNSPLLPNPDVTSEIPQSGRRTLLPTPQIGFNKRATDDEAWFTSINSQNYSDSFRNIPVRDFESEASPLTINSPSITGSPVNFNAEPSILTEQSSPIISSNVHILSRATHHRHSRTRQTRCVCLPPKSLKASVGNAIFDTASVLLLILEWNVDWLVQQQKNHDPPPISTCLRKVVNTYEDHDEYYNTYLPLMLLETWQRIYMSWTHLHQATSPYFCEITSYSVETHSIKVQCQAVFKSSDAERGLFPEEGNIIMVKFGTKEKGGIKILGYIRDVKVKPFDASTGSVNASYKCLKYTAGESLQMLLLTFSGAYSSDDFDTNQLIRIQILCNINSTLKQNDALLNLKNSPLYKNVLNPLTDGLRMVTVVTRNADPLKMKNNVSECVRDIIKGITSPHPLPLLTIAKSLPSSDRLLVLPPLIEMMKSSYKNKVLLCTRTTKALTDIGFNLCGGPIKFVILGKKSDIHQKLRKYLLEEVATKKLSKELSEDTPKSEDGKNDLLVNTKLDILKNCDVVLSLIRNCHNDLVARAYADGDCIAQMCCIIDEANLCTEPEILIPLLYGISKLILIGDPDVPAKVCSKTAANFDYNRSLFHRAYELDLASE